MPYAIDYHALAPELILTATLVAVFALDLIVPRRLQWITAVTAVVGVGLAAIPLITLGLISGEERVLFDGGFVVDDFALVLKALFLLGGYLVLLMSVSYIESDRYYQGEYYFLMVASILGSVALPSARDLIFFFIALELVTGPMFLLAAWRKGDLRSNEASLKFYVIGVLSAALLLYGFSFLYGLTGQVGFAELREAAAGVADEPAFVMAVLLVLAGLGFKVSAAPFHFWAPDTYQGSPTPVTAYLSVNSKAAGFVGLLLLTYYALPVSAAVWGPAIWILAALSMTLANFAALRQENIVRLLAYSSIAQAGFMLVPLSVAAVTTDAAVRADAVAATVVYLLIYAFMNLGAFAIVIAGAAKTGTGEIDGWAGFGSYAPRLGVLAAVFFFSLAGIPPLAGWFAKFAMFRAVLGGGSGWTVALAVIAAINAVVALYYYARVVKVMWMDPAPEEAPAHADRDRPVAGSLNLALGLAAAAVLVLGIVPGIVTYLSEAAKVLAFGG